MSSSNEEKESIYFDDTLTVLGPVLAVVLIGLVLGLVFLG